jgi:hypothetical protein
MGQEWWPTVEDALDWLLEPSGLTFEQFKEKQYLQLINPDFARNLLCWKNSGFSIDNSVKVYAWNDKAGESLAQYIARAPVSLEKIK